MQLSFQLLAPSFTLALRAARSLVDLGRLHDQGLVDVGNHTAASDGRLDQGIEFLVSADRELQVAGGDALDLEVLAGVARELEHLSCEVLQDRGRVHGGRGTNAAAGIYSCLEESVDSAHGELHGG